MATIGPVPRSASGGSTTPSSACSTSPTREGITTAAAADLLAERRDRGGTAERAATSSRERRGSGPTCGRDRSATARPAAPVARCPPPTTCRCCTSTTATPALGPQRRRPGRHVPHDPHGPGARPEDLGPQPHGQGGLRRVRARATRARRSARPGRCGAGHDIVLPYYRDTGVMLTLGHDRRADPARRARPRRRPEQRGPADAEPLGLVGGQRHHRLVADRHAAPPRRRPRLRRQAPRRGPGGGQLLRRGRHLEGRLPRGAQLRRHPPAPDGVRLREQRLRHLGADERRSRPSTTSPTAPTPTASAA